MHFKHDRNFTGIRADDRRINRELLAMGAFDSPTESQPSTIERMFTNLSQFLTWLRWRGEVSVYGCRVGASYARALEAVAVKA